MINPVCLMVLMQRLYQIDAETLQIEIETLWKNKLFKKSYCLNQRTLN